ncbi:MAG: hypothetical protein ACXAAI_04330 [Promethearchaeota archaeon]
MIKQMERDKTEIIDFSGENFSTISIPSWVPWVIVSILAVFNVFFMMLIPGTPIPILLSIGLIGVFIGYYYYIATKYPGKLRKFTISDEGIEIIFPDKPQFNVDWEEFESIEVEQRKIDMKPYLAYQFCFGGGEIDKNITLSLLDFHKHKVFEILRVLRGYAVIKNKNFKAVKGTGISGIYLVEDLDIDQNLNDF